MIHFTFETAGFADPEGVLAQNVNRIEGNALARWLSRELKAQGFVASDVWAEDHGWDFSVQLGDATYLISCSLAGDDDDGEVRKEASKGEVREGHVVLHKSRSMMDKLWGRSKFEKGDALITATRGALAGHDAVGQVEEA